MRTTRSRLSREEFQAAFKAAMRVRVPGAQVLYVPQSERLQVAAVVSKKVANRAVVRNRLRRQIYAHIRSLPHLSGIYIILVAKEARTIDHREFLHGIADAVALLSKKNGKR